MRATAPILALAGATPAAAQRSGTYAVVGTGAGGGQQYEGSAQLQATGPQTWTLTWRISGETTRGVGMSDGDRLVVGYVSRGATGVAIYVVQPDGSLVGTWTQGTEGGVRQERLLPR